MSTPDYPEIEEMKNDLDRFERKWQLS